MQKSFSAHSVHVLGGNDTASINAKSAAIEQTSASAASAANLSKIIRSSVLDSPPGDAADTTLESALYNRSVTNTDIRGRQNLHVLGLKESPLKKSNANNSNPLQSIANAFKGIKLKMSQETLGAPIDDGSTQAEMMDIISSSPVVITTAPATFSIQSISSEQLLQELAGPAARLLVLLDSRMIDQFNASHIIGSFNVDVPLLIQKRWARKNSTVTGLGAASTPAKVVNIEGLVHIDAEKERYRAFIELGAHKFVLFNEQMDLMTTSSGSVVATLSQSLASSGKEVYHLFGGYNALASLPEAVGYLSGIPQPTINDRVINSDRLLSPTTAMSGLAIPDSPATPYSRINLNDAPSLAAGSAKQRTSFSLRTSNLRGSMARKAGPTPLSAVTADNRSAGATASSKMPNVSLSTPTDPNRQNSGLATQALPYGINSDASVGIVDGNIAIDGSSTFTSCTPMIEESMSPSTPSEPSTPQNMDPSMIYDWLYLGPDVYSPLAGIPPTNGVYNELQAMGVSCILNMAIEVIPDDTILNNYTYKKFDCRDTPDEKIERMLDDATAYIHQARQNNKKIYVHCKAGKSRSATIVLAYLIRYENMSADQALAFLKLKRPAVSPNIGFMSVLKEYEQVCRRETNLTGP